MEVGSLEGPENLIILSQHDPETGTIINPSSQERGLRRLNGLTKVIHPVSHGEIQAWDLLPGCPNSNALSTLHWENLASHTGLEDAKISSNLGNNCRYQDAMYTS